MGPFTKLRQIGQGAFSTVYLARDEHGNDFVFKEFPERFRQLAYREFLHLKSSSGPGVVKALDWIPGDPCGLALQYLPGTSPVPGAIPPGPDLWRMLGRAAEILASVHSAGICVNDLKPENLILVDNQPYLIDFGLATLNLWRDEYLRLSPAYAAPERLHTRINHFAGDIFSLGLTAVELATGALPADQLGERYTGTLSNPSLWTHHIASLAIPEPVISLLAHDPAQRPSALEAAAIFHALAGDDWAPDPLKNLEGQVFSSHLEAVRFLRDRRHLRWAPGDDIGRILDLASLEALQEGMELITLDEAECFAAGTDDYARAIGVDLAGIDIHSIVHSGQRLILLRSGTTRTRLFSRLATLPGVWSLEPAELSDISPLTSSEIRDILSRSELPLHVRDSINAAGEVTIGFLSALLREAPSAESGILSEFLEALAMPVPLEFLERLWPDWAALAATELAAGRIALRGGRLTTLRAGGELPQESGDAAFKKALEFDDPALAARLAFLTGRYDQARKLLEEQIGRWIKRQRYDAAFDLCEWFSGFLSDWPPSLRKRHAFLMRKTGRFAEALEIYRGLQNEGTSMERATISGDSAIVLAELGRFDEAAATYEQALVTFRNEGPLKAAVRILNNLGGLHYRIGANRKALAAYNEAITLADGAPGAVERTYVDIAIFNLASIHRRTGQWSRCRLTARRAVAEGRPPFAIPAEILILSCLHAVGETAGLLQGAYDLLARPDLSGDPETHALVLAEAAFLLRFLPEGVEPDFPGSLRFDRIQRERVFRGLHNGRIREALDARDTMTDPAETLLVDAAIDGREDVLRDTLRTLADQENVADAFYLLTHLAAWRPLPKSLRAEANALLSIYTFAPLTDQLERQGRESAPPQLALLWEVITSIHRETEFHLTLRAVLTALLKVNRLQRAVFFQLKLGEFIPILALDDHLEELPLDTLRVSGSILEETVRHGAIRFLTNLQEDAGVNLRASILGLGLRQAMCCPLAADGETLGVIYADTTVDREFGEEEKAVAQAIVIQSRAAIEKNLLLRKLREQQGDAPVETGDLLGKSPAMQKVFAMLKSVGAHNVNVVISGETGSGKEMIARALHRQYAPDAPFVAVNCAAIPETLLESELFGYAKGAFTGASAARKGKIELAAGGTLFLDEIGDMPLLLQAKLLRVLQDRSITPLGESRPVEVDFRVIAATNRDLAEMVEQNLFRNDLLYRLRVLEIPTPALRERRDDIALLVHHFLLKYARKFGKDVRSIGLDALRYLQGLPYPGNVRELENLIERAVVLSTGPELGRELFAVESAAEPVDATGPAPLEWTAFQAFKKDRVRTMERLYAERLVNESEGNMSRAAQRAGMNRVQLYRLLRGG
jgi:two-component system, NtrC family, response regulator HydG